MLDSKLGELQDRLTELQEQRTLDAAKRVVKSVVSLIVPSAHESEFRLFIDGDGKLTTKASWFFFDEEVIDRRATYTLGLPGDANLDVKVFGVTKPNAKTISWAVGLTPNFEDEPFNGKFNVGIDFIIPEAKDSVIVAVSKNYVIRTIQLKGDLTPTFLEILDSWTKLKDTTRKKEFHEGLWNSLDLQPINKMFYQGISQRFISLRQHLETNKVMDTQHAAQFANRLIGRVIFTWFLDKKELLDTQAEYFKSEPFENDTDYYRNRLEPLFFEVLNTSVQERTVLDVTTPYLNGGLFEPKPGDFYQNSVLNFPQNYFGDLFDFFRGYNFTTDESTSDFQQVAIDPEMLGRIFENLLAELSEDTGEQARKAKGAFYTPREIVDFMCRESLKSYLRAKIRADENLDSRLVQLVDATERQFHDQDKNWRRDLKPYKGEILEALDELKVIDPACGSGAFPIGMMQLLVKVYERLDPRFDRHKAKLSIIEKNIYGVDIEPMAVEISRLRAWLALVVDEETSSKNVKPLPNLDFKFVVANSLVGLEPLGQVAFFEDRDLDLKLQQIRESYFKTESSKQKYKLREKYQSLVQREMTLFAESERTSQLKSFRPFETDSQADFFDPEQMFGFKNFDIVVGNPPYISALAAKKTMNPKLRSRYKELYTSAAGAYDMYILFLEKGLRLAGEKGTLAFITPTKFLSAKYAEAFRSYSWQSLATIVDFENQKVFDSAGVSTLVSIFQQRPERESVEVERFKGTISEGASKSVFSVASLTEFPENLWGHLKWGDYDLVSDVYRSSMLLENVSYVVASSTAAEADEYALHVTGEYSLNAFRKVNTGNISPVFPLWGFKDYSNKREKIREPYLPAHVPNDRRREMFGQPKVIISKLAKRLTAMYDAEGHYASSNTVLVLSPQEPFTVGSLTAILNSSFMQYIYRTMFSGLNLLGSFQFQAPQVRLLPVTKKPSETLLRDLDLQIHRLVGQGHENSENKSVFREINALVYELYGLDKGFIPVIEKALNPNGEAR